MKLLRIKKAKASPVVSAPDVKEGRVLSNRNETKLRQALNLLQEVVSQVEGEEIIQGKMLVAWDEGDTVQYGLAAVKGASSEVEILIAKDDELGDKQTYPLCGFRKSGRIEVLATAALTEITLDELGDLEVKAACDKPKKKDEEDDDEEDSDSEDDDEEDSDSEDDDSNDDDDTEDDSEDEEDAETAGDDSENNRADPNKRKRGKAKK